MRQLKTFLRNRKADMLGCGTCECFTLKCWREANENCGCGETGDGFSGIQVSLQSGTANILLTYKGVEYATTLANGVVGTVVWSGDKGSEEDANKIKSLLNGTTWEEGATLDEVKALIVKALS